MKPNSSRTWQTVPSSRLAPTRSTNTRCDTPAWELTCVDASDAGRNTPTECVRTGLAASVGGMQQEADGVALAQPGGVRSLDAPSARGPDARCETPHANARAPQLGVLDGRKVVPHAHSRLRSVHRDLAILHRPVPPPLPWRHAHHRARGGLAGLGRCRTGRGNGASTCAAVGLLRRSRRLCDRGSGRVQDRGHNKAQGWGQAVPRAARAPFARRSR